MERTATLLLLVAAAGVATPRQRWPRAASGDFTEDSCILKDGGVGVCRPFETCDAARQAFKHGERPIVCSYEEFTPIVCCPPEVSAGAKANKMCTKYADAVYVLEAPVVLIPGAKPILRDTCALKGAPLVLGGEEAAPNEFPHMALLGYGSRTSPDWQCGGTLVSDRFVLTAAHCLVKQSGDLPLVVRLGELNLKNDNEPKNKHEDYFVGERFPHPEYKTSSKYFDVGLLKTDRVVTFTRSIRPACLNTIREISDAKAIGTGWGKLEWADDTGSDKLMKLDIPLQKGEVCKQHYRTPSIKLRDGFLDESMVCAGDLAGGKDTCQGDSGGPLQTRLKSPYCMYSIIGVTNFGPICGTPNSPAVYARVSHYLPWIESVVWPGDV